VIKKSFIVFLLAGFALFFSACGKESKENQKVTNKVEFGWKDGVSSADIPDFPIKGNLGGKEVQFQYINFEKWHGSNDNVLNFSLMKPSQNCGFIDDFQGFRLVNKGNTIGQGSWAKGKFDDDPKTYEASYTLAGGNKSGSKWNCALNIESIDGKNVKGKIAMFFNDDSKSWIAGKFVAVVCSN